MAKTTIHKMYSVVYILFICSIYCFMLSAIVHLECTAHTYKYVWTLYTKTHTNKRIGCTHCSAAQSIELHAYNQISIKYAGTTRNRERERESGEHLLAQNFVVWKTCILLIFQLFSSKQIFPITRKILGMFACKCENFSLSFHWIYPVIISI